MKKNELWICFSARPELDRLVTRLYTSMIKESQIHINAGFITSNLKESGYIQNTILDKNIQIHEVSTYFKKHWNEFTHERLVYYEQKYECSPIWKYIYSDRFLIEKNFEYCIKITVGYFYFFEQIFSEYKYQFYYDESVSTIQSYIAYLVGRKWNVTYIAQIPARGGIENMYNYLSIDPMDNLPNFNNDYLDINYSNNEIIRAEKFLDNFEKKDPRPFGMNYSEIKLKNKPKFKWVYALSPLKFIKNRLDKYKNDKYFYMYYQSYRRIFNNEKFLIRYHISKKYYNNADYSKKYIFYPLHYQPESSTLVRAKKYEKQLFYIDSWAKSLPADTWLYVKEHYVVLGNRPLSFYKELEKYPNVVLVSPWESSRKLILHSQAVTTLTGTAGFEAMLLRKPVIISGEVFYQKAPGVVKVDDIYGKYINIIKNWKKPTREETVKFICEYFRNLSVGCSDYTNKDTYTEENIRALATDLYNKMLNIVEISN